MIKILKKIADSIENFIVPKVEMLNLVHFFVMTVILLFVDHFTTKWYYLTSLALILGVLKETIDKYIRGEEFKLVDAGSTFLAGIINALMFI